MNTEVMFSSKSDLWETPQDLFDRLDAEFGFDLDACALPQNAKCERYYTPEQDGLFQPWDGVVWCNPPYGRDIGKWVQKAYEENKKENNFSGDKRKMVADKEDKNDDAGRSDCKLRKTICLHGRR